MNQEKLIDLCEQYHIDQQIPLNYIKYLRTEGHFYYNIPCGKGKTIGLAIAAACDDTLCFNYVASTHSRLREFVDTLSRFGVKYHYIRSSSEVLMDSEEYPDLQISRIVILTSSMLLQFKYERIKWNFFRKDNWGYRALVIDELPKILLQVYYDYTSYQVFKNYKPHRYNKYWYDVIHKLFIGEDLWVEFDAAINTNSPFQYEKRKKVFESRERILELLAAKKLPEPKKYGEDDKNFEYNITYFSIPELYTGITGTSIVLDATADLYDKVLQSTSMDNTCEKDYSKFIDTFTFSHIGTGFSQRDNIIDNVLSVLEDSKETLFEYPGPYYIVTHNSGIYDGMGEEKIVVEDVNTKLNSLFNQIYVNDNKDFILCRSTDNEITFDDFGRVVTENTDIFISNFARSRGSNYFRDCRTVWILGTFYLPEGELSKMISVNNLDLNAKELQLNLAVADAVQEISRGCIRKRNLNEKMNIIMYGDEAAIERIINYLGVKDFNRI